MRRAGTTTTTKMTMMTTMVTTNTTCTVPFLGASLSDPTPNAGTKAVARAAIITIITMIATTTTMTPLFRPRID